ncbi:MAG: hypothetical protein AAGE52_38085 [Myxococcota bacterium]
MTDRALLYADLERAFTARDPRLGEMICQYVQQPDPPENAPEDFDTRRGRAPNLPRDAWTLQRVRSSLGKWAMYGKGDDEKHAIRKQAWESLSKAPHPPPRLRLGEMLIALYEQDDEWARKTLTHVIRNVRIGWGVWRGIKKVYKIAEERFDAEMFGLLAWRFDRWSRTPQTHEVSGATYAYLRRRSWRFLRKLGESLPEVYVNFAVEVMRNFGQGQVYGTWILAQIWAHQDLIGERHSWIHQPPKDLSRRAFDDAWKQSADPLLRLIEDAENDAVLDFAIRSLESDFPETIRRVEPKWLARIGQKSAARIHRFVIDLLQASPELHQSKLKGLGLHDMVLGLLKSRDAAASKYAADYANAHAPDLDDAFLIEIAASGQQAARELAVARFEKRSGKDIGLDRLIAMLRVNSLKGLAGPKIEESFSPADLNETQYLDLRLGDGTQQSFVKEFYKKAKQLVPAAFLKKVVEHPRMTSNYQRNQVLQELGKRDAADIGVEWIKAGVLEPRYANAVQQWILNGKLTGANLDVEWIKGLVMRSSTRNFAIRVLSNRKLVEPHRVGLGWLLAMSRQADEQLATFAHRYLLQNFTPADFAGGQEGDEAGIARIWSLLGTGEAEPVRRFAALYLTVHHPKLGPKNETARNLGVQPRLTSDAYGLAHVRPLFEDGLAEVRRFATLIARYEIGAWNDTELAYRLATSRHPETRRFGLSALLSIGEESATRNDGPVDALPLAWLSAAPVFALTESSQKSTRQAAMSLLRRHYDTIGGPTRLAWLMESPERDVRLFAVRLLWENRSSFENVAALRQFLRTILFGLPPGRMERRADGALVERSLPASVAKRRLIEVVRDMAVESREFAAIAQPVLEEFMNSEAKGEWQTCVAAIARVRRAHPDLTTALPAVAPIEVRA